MSTLDDKFEKLRDRVEDETNKLMRQCGNLEREIKDYVSRLEPQSEPRPVGGQAPGGNGKMGGCNILDEAHARNCGKLSPPGDEARGEHQGRCDGIQGCPPEIHQLPRVVGTYQLALGPVRETPQGCVVDACGDGVHCDPDGSVGSGRCEPVVGQVVEVARPNGWVLAATWIVVFLAATTIVSGIVRLIIA